MSLNQSVLSSQVSTTQFFNLPEGQMAYEDSGTGVTTVVCVPGLGDTRAQYRLLAPLLVKRGYRVIVVDPRGHGDSSTAFSNYSASLTGQDLIAFLSTLNTPVILVGNSAAGGSAAWVAANLPQKVAGLVLLGAFLRDLPPGIFLNSLMHLIFSGPWARTVWISYYKTLFKSKSPADQDAYTSALKTNLKEPGRFKAVTEMLFTSKADIEKCLAYVKAPVLAVSGSKDPDFKNPERELDWIVSKIGGDKALVEGAGHYPHLEFPDQIEKLIVNFVTKLNNRSVGRDL